MNNLVSCLGNNLVKKHMEKFNKPKTMLDKKKNTKYIRTRKHKKGIEQ